MDAGELELRAVIGVFRGVARRWEIEDYEIKALLGLDGELREWTRCLPLEAGPERRLRLLCELDRWLVMALGEQPIAAWLRSQACDMEPLVFLSLGVDEVRAMIAAARCRAAELGVDP